MESQQSKKSDESVIRFFQDDSFADECIPEFDAAGNLHSQFKSIREMLEIKEDMTVFPEEDFKHKKYHLTDITHSNLSQYDIDVLNYIEIGDLQKIINIHNNTIDEVCDKIENNINPSSVYEIFNQELDGNCNSLEIQKYKDEIKSLRFDLDVMESLYKNCFDEMLHQEKTISNLREACFDHSVSEFNLKIDNELLLSQLNYKYKVPSHQCCFTDEVQSKEIKDELSGIEFELNSLKNILLEDVMKESEKKDKIIEELKKENIRLKNEISLLRKEIETLKKKSNRKKEDRNKKSKNILQMLCMIKRKLKHTHGYLVDNSCRKVFKNEFLPIKYNLLEFENKNKTLKDENLNLNKKITNLEQICTENNETIEDLQKKLENSEESLKNLQDKYRKKTDCISWLESRLSESTAKGKELCNKSDDIFECVQKLLKQLREEKRSIMEKKTTLQNVLKFLIIKEEIPKYTQMEDIFKN